MDNSKNIIKIAVISDLHVMAPQLLINEGAAIEDYMARDRKMLRESAEILDTLVANILELKPDLVLVTGDLTKDGERVSHQLVASQLQRLVDNGIQVLVTPGNHDINNPDARVFDGDTTTPTETITRSEFADIYRDMGYDDLSQRDPDTLSYCRVVNDKLAVLAIDACMDRLNTFISHGDARDHTKASGSLEASSQQWLADQASKASAAGKRVIAMMHHHLVPHFERQDQLLGNYIITRHDAVAKQLMEAGVHTIFTGHLHVTDAATQQNAERTDSIVEISTGSAICYPFAMRVATVDRSKKKLDVVTRWLNATQSCPNLRELGRERIINATPVIASMISGKA